VPRVEWRLGLFQEVHRQVAESAGDSPSLIAAVGEAVTSSAAISPGRS
jgi:hypothetical protein